MTPGNSSPESFSEIVEAEGHLIDSRLLAAVFDKVIERGARYHVLRFTIGRTNDEFSQLEMQVTADTREGLRELVEELIPLGCHPRPQREARLEEAGDGFVPDDFYSTTNHRTQIRHGGRWVDVEGQRMDAVVVVRDGGAACRKLRDVRRGEQVVCGLDGIRVLPEFQERDRLGFAFMTGDVSTERRVEVSVSRVVDMMREVTGQISSGVWSQRHRGLRRNVLDRSAYLKAGRPAAAAVAAEGGDAGPSKGGRAEGDGPAPPLPPPAAALPDPPGFPAHAGLFPAPGTAEGIAD